MKRIIITSLFLSITIPLIAYYSNDEIKEIKEKVLQSLPEGTGFHDCTHNAAVNPYYTDALIEAYFNLYDFPGLPKENAVHITEQHYDKFKVYYRKVREKKFLLHYFRFKFDTYYKEGAEISGGFLSSDHYIKDKKKFFRDFTKDNIWSNYYWRIKGEKHETTMILAAGKISIPVPQKDAGVLLGEGLFSSVKDVSALALLEVIKRDGSFLYVKIVKLAVIRNDKKKIYYSD